MGRGIAGIDSLVVLVGNSACAIPLQHVAEVMRPLSIERLSGVPDFVAGVAVIRGAALPVVNLAAVLNRPRTSSWGRFVTLKLGARSAALAVDAVVGVRRIDAARLTELPPLLGGTDRSAVEAIGATDEKLLVVLRASRVLPDEVWTALTDRTATR